MEGSKNSGHRVHTLVRLNEDQLISNQSADCSRCGEMVSAPCFGCAEDCGFYLHKVCADAPSRLNHPFLPDHPLVLQQKPPINPLTFGIYEPYVSTCYFCGKECKELCYHYRSRQSYFHIGCALFTFNIAQSKSKELEHVAPGGSLICTETDDYASQDCFWCWEPAADHTYFHFHFGIHLHKNCIELPFRMNHVCHRKHPLLIQYKFDSDESSCKICQESIWNSGSNFFYGCSLCEFAVHFKCASQSPPPIVEDANHKHPFTLFWRQVPFICDACGTEGSCVAYKCYTCSIIIHSKCVSLPRCIKSKWHDHHLFHRYFFHREDFGTAMDCVICREEVNTEHESYSCSKCNVIFHVNCALKDKDLYYVVENEDEEPLDIPINSITNVLEWNDAGDASLIEHFKHIHNLKLSDEVRKYEDKCCDGCLLLISASFYHCSECEFFLHKICAEFPKVKEVWHHSCRQPLVLTSNKVFWCEKCCRISNSFAYACEECQRDTCLRCVIALTPEARTCPGHKHPLFFHIDYTGQCNACGYDDHIGTPLLRCKDCDFSLHHDCFSLPVTVQHKCDEHLFALSYNDDNSYSESHYCDICEKERDSNVWFYRCATCNTSAHINCVLEIGPFIKLGSIYEEEKIHDHPPTFVKKSYYYPDCDECGKRCEYLCLECTKSGCNYIVHWGCVVPRNVLRWYPRIP